MKVHHSLEKPPAFSHPNVHYCCDVHLDSGQEMCDCHSRRHSVSSLSFAILTEANEHPRVDYRFIGVVVVGQELLSELALVAVV